MVASTLFKMLGFAGSGFVKSLIFYQVICRNCYRNVENAEKTFREKKKELARHTVSLTISNHQLRFLTG